MLSRRLKELARRRSIGQEELRESNGHYLHTYTCRTGTIAEHIDLDAVFDFYCKLGIYAPKDEVRRLCDPEIMHYGIPNAPFVHLESYTAAELITTGLPLGYPLESTASIFWGTNEQRPQHKLCRGLVC